MPPKRDLTEHQIREIKALHGQLPAAEVRKRFGIGTNRVYKIWQEGNGADLDIYSKLEEVQKEVKEMGRKFDLLTEMLEELGDVDMDVEEMRRLEDKQTSQIGKLESTLEVARSLSVMVPLAGLGWKIMCETMKAMQEPVASDDHEPNEPPSGNKPIPEQRP